MTIAGNTVLDFGDAALMVQLGSTAEVLAWAAALRDADLPGVRDVVPAARTVLVTLDGPRYQGDVRQRLLQMRVADDEAGPADHCAELVIDHMIDIEIEVVYDGPDLPEVARLTGLTAPEVVEAHTRTPWQVGFSGFAPGFAYLVDGDPTKDISAIRKGRLVIKGDALYFPDELYGAVNVAPFAPHVVVPGVK